MIITILKTVATFIILMIIGTNLLGMIVRTLLMIATKEKSESEYLKELSKKNKTVGMITLLLLVTISIGYFYALNNYFNYALCIAAAMVMLSRFPDLMLEIKTGQKISRKNMKNRPIDIIFNIINWLALPVIWYSFTYIR